MFEAFLAFELNSTLAWAKLPGHPIVIILRAKGALPPSGRHTIHYISAETNLLSVCPDCWSLPNQNILVLARGMNDTSGRPGQSKLYIPVVGYIDSVTYLRTDVQQLPPACFTGDSNSMNTTGCHSLRMVRLMETINNPNVTHTQQYLCGSGVMKQTKDEIYLTSLVDSLWEQSIADAETRAYIGRLLLSTQSGVFRTSAPTEKTPITLPNLYQPNFDPWYLRAVSSTGWGVLIITPPMRPLFDSPTDGPVMTFSVRVRHGYIPADNQEESLAAVAAVMAVEVQYARIHSLLYGEDGLRGSGPDSNFRCSGRIRCYLIDQYAAVLSHPDFMGSASSPLADFVQAQEAGKAIFFGNLEPGLMQMLADERFMLETSDEDVTFTDGSYWGLLRTWSANPKRVPLLAAFGGGYVLVDSVPTTNAYLVIVDGYHPSKSLEGCGLISQECPAVFTPRIQDVFEDLCLSLQDRVRSNYRQASTVPLLEGFDANVVVQAQRLFENCPVQFPDWVWQLLLAGAGTTVVVMLGLSAQSARYSRKRDLLIARRAASAGGSSGTGNTDGRRTNRTGGSSEWPQRAEVATRHDAEGVAIVREMQAIRSAILIGSEGGGDGGNRDNMPRDVDTLKAAILSLADLLEKVCEYLSVFLVMHF
jgi:hypothetical protein